MVVMLLVIHTAAAKVHDLFDLCIFLSKANSSPPRFFFFFFGSSFFVLAEYEYL
jgi:hypothetical protein